MPNGYYSATGNPATGSEGLSALMRAEFLLIQAGFDGMPAVTGNGSRAVVVNAGGTGLTVTTGTFALAGNFATTGAFNTSLTQGANVTLTLPVVSGTLATLAGTETLSNKTLVAPALGTPVSGVATNLTGTAAALNIGGNAATATAATTATTATNQSGGTVSATTLAASSTVSGAGFTARFSTPGPIGDTVASTGAFTTLSATSTVSGAGFTARFATPGPIGSTSASTGAFTTISATSQITSTLATGTAPLVIASTTNVANLNASSLSGATFAAPGAIGGGTASTGAFTTLSATGALTGAQRTFLSGLTLSRSSATVLAVSAGECADSTNAVDIQLAAFTKSTAGTWASGSGSNGMGTALTIANTTWYHVFAIINAGVADVYFDTSVTAANKPASTTAFRRLGSFRTDGSAQILAFSQNGDEFLWDVTVRDVASVMPLTTAVLATLTVPTGVKVGALYRGAYADSAGASGILFTSPDESDQACTNVGAASSLVSPQANGTFASAAHFQTRTNTSAQIRYRASVTTSNVINIATFGWVDSRGQLS